MKTLEMQPKSGEEFISIQSPDLNRLISSDKIKLMEFIKKAKLSNNGASSLIKYYETILLTPESAPVVTGGEPKWRLLNSMYGSQEISPAAKKDFFNKFNDIYNRTVEVETEPIPKEFIPGVEKGVESVSDNGILAGFPIIDYKVTILDGLLHDED